ncbi:MAG TPA: hypothetical protein VNB06_07860 [Thermoanaerobaculia bacterium]|nr:hypothetical protein [Thermoanaerobaculia bacterium]
MKGFRSVLIGVVTGALTVGAAWANTAERVPAVGANLLPFQVELNPQTENDGVTLSVSGPGNLFLRQVFAAGEPVLFGIEQDGASLADGLYTWEAVLTPRLGGETLREMAAARVEGDEGAEGRLRSAGKIPAEPMVGSGTFRILQGSIVTDQGPEPPAAGAPTGGMTRVARPDSVRVAASDQVIPDDLIVQSSLCVGFDCVNGEVFGFDTIRLKENNLRIRFDDTSSTGSFPRNDWQLTANDSANGGAEKFSIDDITNGRTPFTIEGNSRTNSLYVDNGGRVGFGTATPALELHVSDGDSPGLRLEQNTSSGFQAQSWDIAGNETNFFVRDVTSGSKLPFRIRPGAPSSALDISASGNVGIGTASPDVDLHILRTGEAPTDVQLKIETNTDPAIDLKEQDSGVTWRFINNDTAMKIVDIGTGADGAEEFVLTQAGNLTITGQLVTGGPQCGAATPCDGVFSPEFALESIEEHAAQMWANSFLPAVGPTPAKAPFNVSEKMGGVLNELEKAHIFIEQLHSRLSDQEAVNLELRRRLSDLESALLKQTQSP